MYIVKRGLLLLSIVILSYLNGYGQTIKAKFTITKASLCQDSSFSFTDNSTASPGTITTRTWYFGDGSKSTSTNPTHAYTSAGTYTVSLAVKSSDGLKDSTTQSVTAYPLPVASYKLTRGTYCQRFEMTFRSTSTISSGSISSISWDFGDGSSTATGDSFLKVYGTAGTYTFTMKAKSDKGCVGTYSKSLVINPTPKAAFTYTPRCQDSTVSFDASTSDVSKISVGGYTWIFDDNTTATGKTATHKYTTSGQHKVRLAISNAASNGCNDTATTNITIYDNPVIKVRFQDVCFDSALVIRDSSTGVYKDSLYYNWDFGHSSTGSDNNVTYWNRVNPLKHFAFPKSGAYTVKLTLKSNHGCTSTFSQGVNINPLPKPDFKYKNGCGDSLLTFTSTTPASPTISTYTWDFGDKTARITGQTVQHAFTKAGVYTVRMIATTSKGCRDSMDHNITIYPRPVSKFSVTSNCQDSLSTFGDLAQYPGSSGLTDTIKTWWWDFGDGNTSTSRDASHVYNKYGTYTVKHVISTRYGCTDTALNNNVVIYQPPTADFQFAGNCQYDSVQFVDKSTAPTGSTVTNYLWNFGDGEISSLKNPKHSYQGTGTFVVSLKVTSSDGCGGLAQHNITIHDAPVAKFATSASCIGEPVYFVDQSTTTPDVINRYYDWDYGDTTAIDHSSTPSHTYKHFGNYTIKLVIYADYGGGIVCHDSTTKDISIAPLPHAAFTAKLSNCLDSFFTFNDQSTISKGSLKTWSWNFGDGKTGAGSSVQHMYSAPGTYKVVLKVYSALGCVDSTYQMVNVNPLADPGFTYISRCADSALAFTDTSTLASGTITQWAWDFGDNSSIDNNQNPSHTFPKSGSYNVKLTTYTDQGCPTSTTEVVNVKALPSPKFQPVGNRCEQGAYNLLDITVPPSGTSIIEWTWDFGDGGTASGKSVSHVFQDSGRYPIKLRVRDDQGCIDSVTIPTKVYPLPDIKFGWRGYCDGANFLFRDSSTVPGGIESYQWNFGDGGSSSSYQLASHTYSLSDTPGVYQVTLTATASSDSGGCKNSLTKPLRLYPLPVAKFGASTVCLTQPTIFTDSSTVSMSNIESWDINFGDGQRQTFKPGDIMYHIYNVPGNYTAHLTIRTVQGCADSTITAVQVLPKPKASFVATPYYVTILHPNVTFLNTSLGGLSYNWDFGDGYSSQDTAKKVRHTYQDTGIYHVGLVVENFNGCYDTTRFDLQVNNVYTMFAPNAFSPNDDKNNDEWKAVGAGYLNFSVVIIDRWGQIVFQSNDINKGWKGDYNGNGVPVPEGVYKYVIRANSYDNVDFESLKGSILLFR